MNQRIVTHSGSDPEPMPVRAVVQRLGQIFVSFTLIVAAGSLGAGTWRWPRLWVLSSAGVLLVAALAATLVRVNPEVIVGRSRIGAGTKLFEKIILPLYAVAGLAVPVVAGIETVRLGGPLLPIWTLPLGAALYFLGGVPVGWAMMVNPFLEQTVRIQRDRGHYVVMEGPYRFVRHPMYTGTILQQIAGPLILGSSWAFAPAALALALLVLRTLFEDRTLLAELEGYEAYMAKTRYRLLPGIW